MLDSLPDIITLGATVPFPTVEKTARTVVFWREGTVVEPGIYPKKNWD